MGIFDFLKKKKGEDVLDLTHKKQAEDDATIPPDIKKRIERDIANSSANTAGSPAKTGGKALMFQTERKSAGEWTGEKKRAEEKRAAEQIAGHPVSASISASQAARTASAEPVSGGYASFFKKVSSTAAANSPGADVSANERIQKMSDKISKLEQRVELLERKMDVKSRE